MRQRPLAGRAGQGAFRSGQVALNAWGTGGGWEEDAVVRDLRVRGCGHDVLRCFSEWLFVVFFSKFPSLEQKLYNKNI